MTRLRSLALAVAVGAVTLAVAGLARAATGDLTYRGCVSGEITDFDSCEEIAAAAGDGVNSGLNGAESVTVSADGRWVYAAARMDDSIARFRRDRDNGALTYRGCISGDSNSSCKEAPAAVPDGQNSGMDDVRAVVVGTYGRSVYAISAADDAVARFRRADNGALRFKDCITAEIETDSTGACRRTADAAPNGADTGLDDPKSLALSPDGRWLYTAATLDAAIARFKVDKDDGRLRYRGCITGEQASGPGGSGACDEAASATGNPAGTNSGLSDARGLALSRDGRWLYGVASDDDSVFRFKRSRDNGSLTFRGCISGNLASSTGPGCEPLDTALVGGADSGLDDVRSLALSRDGKSVYAASRSDAAVARFRRDRDNGRLTFRGCISGDIATGSAEGSGACRLTPDANLNVFGDDSGLGAAESVVVSRDGRSVYVSAANDAAVARFKRDRDNGELIFKRCLSGDADATSSGTGACSGMGVLTPVDGDDSGIGFPQFIALSPDDRSLYVAAGDDDGVARFRRQR